MDMGWVTWWSCGARANGPTHRYVAPRGHCPHQLSPSHPPPHIRCRPPPPVQALIICFALPNMARAPSLIWRVPLP
eukprot:4015117-Prymnesium_polylepis.1